jgi:phosphatidylinositol alpha-mannosyltransferase
LHPRKGVDGLLQALSRIPSTQHVQLVIAGDGKERPRLERFAAELHLQERVRFVGTALGELKAYLLQNALCLAAPSVGWEGQGIVVLEGYAAGRPVIVSQLPGFADLVRPGETGWTVPPSSPSALARVLAEVFADRAELTRRGERARELAQQYSWEAVARRHLGLYRDLLTANRVAHSA